MKIFGEMRGGQGLAVPSMPCARLSMKHPAQRGAFHAADPQAAAGPGLIGIAPVPGLGMFARLLAETRHRRVSQLELDNLEQDDTGASRVKGARM